jgi:hypothetical protein
LPHRVSSACTSGFRPREPRLQGFYLLGQLCALIGSFTTLAHLLSSMPFWLSLIVLA